jgi:kynurenine formamidase
MKIRTLIAGYVLALALFLFAQRHPVSSSSLTGFHAVVDLTHASAEKSAATAVHFGTRIEAPAYFAPGLWNIEQIPGGRLIAPLVVLDMRANAARQSDYQISVEDIAKWELTHNQIPLGSVVIARTGWDSRWNSIRDYRNADARGTMHFPGYSTDAAKFLVAGRNVIGLGIDTLDVDYGPSKDFPVRQYTLAHSVYQLENVANLDRAPDDGGMVVVGPSMQQNASVGPVRILALIH